MPFFPSSEYKALLAGLALCLALTLTAGAEPGPFLAVGQTAPSIILKDLAGVEQQFPKTGKWNVIFFWSLFCHTCIEEIPIISKDLQAYKSQPVQAFFVSLDTEKMKKGVENFLQKRSLAIPVLLEEIASESFKAADQWGVKTTPAAFLVGPDGKVAFSHEGPFDPEIMLNLLKAGLAKTQAGN